MKRRPKHGAFSLLLPGQPVFTTGVLNTTLFPSLTYPLRR
jgi:hypothetical protein